MKLLGNLRLRTKIILVCVIILLLNSIICGGLYYNYAFKDTLKNYYSSSEDMVSQIRMQLGSETQSIAKRVHAIFNNMSFYVPISQYLQNQDTANYVKLLSDISDVVTEFHQGDRYIHSVSIETDFGSFDNFTRIRNHEFDFMESDMHSFFSKNPGESICWYPAMVSPIFKSSDMVIPVIYRFTLNRREIYVIVSLQQSEIEKFLKDTYSSYDEIFIADRNGENILNCGEREARILDFFSGDELEHQNAVCKEVKIDKETYLATYTEMSGTGWRICAMRRAESLVGNLGVSFNYMIQKINHLVTELNANIEELREEKENVKKVLTQKRKAELKALQAQINPHFLYNTLNAITWQAADQGVPEISILSNSLGKFFRISLSRGKEVITVREELEHVENYLRIQGIRYKDKIQYEFHVAEDIKDLFIIKLVLQPLVENSIYHGIKVKKGTGHIRICGRRAVNGAGMQTLQICVEDDGEGIEEERLKVIKDGLSFGRISQDSGYGIYNVNERIRLYYGDAYGLLMESERGKITRATVRIPVQTTEEI